MTTTHESRAASLSALVIWLRWLIAAVLLTAGVAKLDAIANASLTGPSIRALASLAGWVPDALSTGVIVSLALEFVVAFLLLAKKRALYGAWLGVALALTWSATLPLLEALGVSYADCGCFGRAAELTYGEHSALNLAMLSGCLGIARVHSRAQA